MKRYITQKTFSWGGKYLVKDEEGNLKYSVKGKPLTRAHNFSVQGY